MYVCAWGKGEKNAGGLPPRDTTSGIMLSAVLEVLTSSPAECDNVTGRVEACWFGFALSGVTPPLWLRQSSDRQGCEL
ncbi:hypothetical protein NDU88_005012 [Pleurodeles waltl]|uniref:Uncharacterized protein n=1 Tax=Pleurodeles waltl TaxID=8319 RepID=A0AAV7QDT1_PLEWA|nr:hypothetical protein NDU88_005012 [Pleurodeles waltl]